MKLLFVVGARPNFMKVAPLLAALARRGERGVLVHTGQHYDAVLSDLFVEELGLPPPDHALSIGAGTQLGQLARVLVGCERVFEQERPDRVVVVGDVTSTLGAALAAVKLGLPVDHVEAGLRSFDRTMPEEQNRVVVDTLSALLFTHSPEARAHLEAEGRAVSQIVEVGNVMADALLEALPRARSRGALREAGVAWGAYGLVTLHRPANVDNPAQLERLLGLLGRVGRAVPLLFPVHPRTAARLEGLLLPKEVRLLEPRGYLDFLALLDGARLVLTDSGGVQEESSLLDVPCLTLRDSTERPVTVALGSNRLVGAGGERLLPALEWALALPPRPPERSPSRAIPLWDGRAAERIVDVWRALP